MSSGLQSMSSWLVQVFLLLFLCYVNWEFERRVCRMEELRVCISVLVVRQWRRAWEGAGRLPGVILIKENIVLGLFVCISFCQCLYQLLKMRMTLFVGMDWLSRVVFRKNLFYWTCFYFVGFISAFYPTCLKCSHLWLLELDSFKKPLNICLCFTKIKVIIWDYEAVLLIWDCGFLWGF